MRWAQQVLHVTGKDLRLTRWYLSAYVLVLSLAVAVALRSSVSSGTLWPVVVGLFALVITSLVVHADSPWRSDAFWVTRPLDASAVTAAKLLFSGLVIGGLALAAQAVVLVAGYAVKMTDLFRMMPESALAFGNTLLMSMVVAALTRNLRSAILLFVLQFVFFNVVWIRTMASFLTSGTAVVSPLPLHQVLLLLGVVAPLSVIVFAYNTRDRRHTAAFALVVLLLVPNLGFTLRARAALPGSASLPNLADSATILSSATLELLPNSGRQRPNQRYTIDARMTGGSEQAAYSLVHARLEFQLADGSSFRAPVEGDVQLRYPLAEEGLRWREKHTWVPMVGVKLSDDQQRRLSAGVSRIVLEGQFRVLEPDVLAAIPFAAGSKVAKGGYRMEIISANTRSGEFEAVVSSVVAMRQLSRRLETLDFPEYALVNRRHGEALRVSQGSSSSESLGLVLLSNELAQRRERFTGQPTFDASLPVDPAWFSGAELLRIVWRDRGRYPVTAVCTSC